MASNLLSKNIEFLLKKNELSSSQLAKASGVDKPVISRILSGKTPNPQVETLKPIADFFSVTIDQLIGTQIELDKKHGVVVSIHRLMVPIIEWKQIAYWMDIKDNYNPTNTIDAKSTSSKDSFALRITTDQFEPRFTINSIIIVDPTLSPKNRDYILTKQDENQITIEQVIIENNKTFLKTLHQPFDMKKSSKLICYGVITESHLNLSVIPNE